MDIIDGKGKKIADSITQKGRGHIFRSRDNLAEHLVIETLPRLRHAYARGNRESGAALSGQYGARPCLRFGARLKEKYSPAG
jgi:hypothetical protein